MDFKLNNVVSMWKVREMVDKATNLVMNYTETESKVIFWNDFVCKTEIFRYLKLLYIKTYTHNTYEYILISMK